MLRKPKQSVVTTEKSFIVGESNTLSPNALILQRRGTKFSELSNSHIDKRRGALKAMDKKMQDSLS